MGIVTLSRMVIATKGMNSHAEDFFFLPSLLSHKTRQYSLYCHPDWIFYILNDSHNKGELRPSNEIEEERERIVNIDWKHRHAQVL